MAKRKDGLRIQVHINGRSASTSGMNGNGVLTVILCRVKRDPRKYSGKHVSRSEWSKERIELTVGGLDSRKDQHLDWLKQDLKIGDEVFIKLLPPGRHDVPIGRKGRLTARLRRARRKAVRAAQRGR